MSEAPSRPTGVRHLIVLLLTLMSVLLYLDRFCVSFAGDYIKEDLGLSQTQMSLLLGPFFFLFYALAQVPSGWLSDRFGARIMLSIYVVSWSLFTAQMGLVAGFTMLLVARLMCGITQAGAYPTAGGVISRWIPLAKRATASAWVGLGGRMGGAMAPILTAFLMVLFVPMSTNVDFTDADLLEGSRLCARLTPFSEKVQQAIAAAELADEGKSTFSKSITAQGSVASQRISFVLSNESETRLRGTIDTIADELRLKQLEQAIAAKKSNAVAEPWWKSVWGQIRKALNLTSSTSLTVKLNSDQRQSLVAAFNGLLDQRELYDESAFAKVNLPRQGIGYAERLKAREDLSGSEVRRFNRLLIEAAFPGEIRKLDGRGWRPVMIVYGLSGVIVAIAIWWVFRNRPEEHSRVNAEERAVIEAGRLATAADTSAKAGRLPMKPFFTSFSLWCNCANQLGTNIGWIFLVTWLSRYFIEMHNVPILERGILVMMPNLIGMVGGFLGGRWVDWLLPRIGLKWSRSLPPIVTRFMAAGGYGMCLYFASQPPGSALNSPWAFTAAFCLIYFSVDLGQSAFWAYAQDAGGKYVGSVLGWGNMWGNLGAAFGPLLYNYLLGETPGLDEWNNLFWLGLIAFVFAGIATFGLDASKPVFVEKTN
jgi:MFS family permease